MEWRRKLLGSHPLFRGQQGADLAPHPFTGNDRLDLGLGLFRGNSPDCRFIEYSCMGGIAQLFAIVTHLLHEHRYLFPVCR
jgi:hypothetical protein